MDQPLDARLAGEVTERLGLEGVQPDEQGVAAFYAAWCAHVPFDNLRKLIGLARDAHPLPGDDPNDFFRAWLDHGTGATCWASANALHSLARSIGFDAARVAGAMLDLPDLNHGSVVVTVDGTTWLLDSSLLTGAPLRFDPDHSFAAEHDGYPSSIERDGDTWMVHAESSMIDDMRCRLQPGVRGSDELAALHERTRAWSVFNTTPYVLRHLPGRVEGLRDLEVTTWTAGHARSTRTLDDVGRRAWLLEAGFSQTVVEAALAAMPRDPALPRDADVI
jgi:N-hydroxyarylamine O-acetyltransferase